MVTNKLCVSDKIRLATAIDTEGNIGIYPNKRKRWKTDIKRINFRPVVRVVNTHRGWLQLLKNIVGNGCLQKPDKNGVSRIEWSCRNAERLLKQILPYLIIKKKQAQIILAWYEEKPKKLYYNDAVKLLESLKERYMRC